MAVQEKTKIREFNGEDRWLNTNGLSTWSYLKKRLKWLFLDADIECLEASVYIFSMWTGWRIAFPHAETMTSPGWQLLSKLIWDPHGCLIIGAFLMVGALLGMYGLLQDSPRPRRLGVILQLVFWVYTGVMLFLQFPYYYGPGLHIIIGMLCHWVFCRVGLLATRKPYWEEMAQLETARPIAKRLTLREVVEASFSETG